MADIPDGTWRLYRDGELVANLVPTGFAFPWIEARVEALPGLGPLRPMLDREFRLSQSEEDAAWEAAYAEVRSAVQLVDPTGKPVAEFLLHIQGDEASWRFSYEPFDEP